MKLNIGTISAIASGSLLLFLLYKTKFSDKAIFADIGGSKSRDRAYKAALGL